MKAFHLPLPHNTLPLVQSFPLLLFLTRSVLSFSVSPLPLIHGVYLWHIHNQTDLTPHILPQWERRRLRQELYTRPSLLISRSQHQTPPPSISHQSFSLRTQFALSFFLSCMRLFSPSFFPSSLFPLFSPII